VIWAKTDAGRAEIQQRALVKERAQRNLLLLIDGKNTEERLLAGLAGISGQDFRTLETLGLIAPVAAAPAAAPTASATATAPSSAAGARAVDVAIDGAVIDFATLRGALGKLISKELGMRGIGMSMVLEEAMTVDDLRDVARRTLKQISDRKGIAAAAEARKVLFGS
jgi:hypothetical protein